MSALVTLSSKLPGDDEINGLDSLASDLAANPDQVICAIVWFDVPKVTRNTEEGTTVPTVRARRVEPIGTVDKVPKAVIDLAVKLQEQRIGREPLPFDQLDSRYEVVHTSTSDDPNV